MSCLAIKGHVTRGKEVIEILEMLGGRNVRNYACNLTDYAYSINGQGIIDWHIPHPNSLLVIYTLEEFLEKYPYKVGDKVQYKGATSCGSVFEVEKMRWEEDTVKYTLRLWGCNYKSSTLPAEYLQPHKEETMEENTDTALAPDLKGEDYSGRRFGYQIPKGYEFECVRNNEIILKPIKPQYPKTYEECCDIIEYPHNVVGGYKAELLSSFQNLLICRDAYWKIAGEQMGLGEPWKPDWLNTEQDKFVLYTHNNVICLNRFVLGHNVLAFPTAEMRDTFLENFKELINETKELL